MKKVALLWSFTMQYETENDCSLWFRLITYQLYFVSNLLEFH